MQCLKQNNAIKILISKCIYHASPSYHSVYLYYLTIVAHFKPIDFSVRLIGGDIGHLLGVMGMTCLFDWFSRGSIIIFTSIGLSVVSFCLIPILQYLNQDFQTNAVYLVVAHTTLKMFFFELTVLIFQTVFVEICPKDKETFFLSIISFLQQLCNSLSLFFGTLIICFFEISKDDLTYFPVSVLGHWIGVFTAGYILLTSNIPNVNKAKTLSVLYEETMMNLSFTEVKKIEPRNDGESESVKLTNHKKQNKL